MMEITHNQRGVSIVEVISILVIVGAGWLYYSSSVTKKENEARMEAAKIAQAEIAAVEARQAQIKAEQVTKEEAENKKFAEEKAKAQQDVQQLKAEMKSRYGYGDIEQFQIVKTIYSQKYTNYPVFRTNMDIAYMTTNGDQALESSGSIFEALCINKRTMVNVQFQQKYKATAAAGIGEGSNVSCENGHSSVSVKVSSHIGESILGSTFLNMKKQGCDFASNYSMHKPVYYIGGPLDAEHYDKKSYGGALLQWCSIDFVGDFWQ